MFCSYCLPTQTFPSVKRIGILGKQRKFTGLRCLLKLNRIHKTPLEDNEISNDCLGDWTLHYVQLLTSYARASEIHGAFKSYHPWQRWALMMQLLLSYPSSYNNTSPTLLQVTLIWPIRLESGELFLWSAVAALSGVNRCLLISPQEKSHTATFLPFHVCSDFLRV